MLVFYSSFSLWEKVGMRVFYKSALTLALSRREGG